MAYIVTKDSIIGDVLDYDSSVADIFFGIGMHCVGCPASRGETIEEAAMVHGIDIDALMKAIEEL